MPKQLVLDYSDYFSGLDRLEPRTLIQSKQALQMMAEEALRLSQREVPHDTGQLQNSGHVEMQGNGAVVGYNKVYAAHLHENPQFRFKGGRKGKYLEDPIKNNLNVFGKFYRDKMAQALV